MDLKKLPGNVARLLACGVVFFAGTQLGGMAASLAGLPAAPLAPGAEREILLLYSLLASPLLALALAPLARRLAGSFAVRAAILSFLTWITYSVCDQLEGLLVSTYAAGLGSAIVASLPAALLCGGALALLFPAAELGRGLVDTWRAFFGYRKAGGWLWRALLASIAFVPIYFAFGLLVLPLVRQAYEQGLYGLQEPAADRLFAVLLIRSILFFVSCLPVTIAWQGSRQSLFLRLGLALFVLVACPSVLVAYWLPVSLRLPHALEILADEFVYAGALVALLTRAGAPRARAMAERAMP